MNLVDIVVVLFLISSAVHGLYQGAAVQVLGFGGFWGGLLLGAVLAPPISGLLTGAGSRAVVSLVVVFGTAVLLGALGRQFGVRIWGRLRKMNLGPVDALVGAGVAMVATLLAVWLIAIMLAAVPILGISGGIQESKVVRAVNQVMPPAPAVFARLKSLFSSAGFPQVFAELEPSPAPGVELPSDPEVRAALEAAGPSTVRIVGAGCGGLQTGSGFVADSGLVVTNAHVVAGIDEPFAEDANGRHAATPVLFDADLDLAVLRVGNLAGAPLTLVNASVARGSGTAVLGYPGGGPLRGEAAAVRDEFDATGRDIYGSKIVTRHVYQMQAAVRSGNSGGPFVEIDGDVIGVVFSRSAYREQVGYSLTSAGEVLGKVNEARGRTERVDTGPCV